MHTLLSLMENISVFAIFMIYVYLAVVMIFIIMENRDISSTLAWILIFLLFPVIGFFVYIFFGRNWKVINPNKKSRIRALRKKTDIVLKELREKQNKYFAHIVDDGMSHDIVRIVTIAQENSDTLLTLNNAVEVLQSGEEKFKRLEQDLRDAHSFIHMEYFIWRVDPLTKRIKDILIAKAHEGVEVRIIHDPIGSFFSRMLHRKYFRDMKKAGINVVPFFNKLSPLKITTLNYLLHRKIVVIDGTIGYTGGMNMGQEYIDGGKKYVSWRDTHMRIEGNATLSLQKTFAVNWEEACNESLFTKKYFPFLEHKIYGHVPMQILSSEPHAFWQPIKQSLFVMVLAAKKNVYIQTPYFIPDSNLFEALKIAALSGVDVKLMITGVADKRIPYWAAFTYFEELLLAGAHIYHYDTGFLHAKTCAIDGKLCSIGTTNMDIRSLHLSYENNVIIYDAQTTQMLEDDFIDDMAKCTQFTLDDYKKITVFAKFRNSFVRLFSPLL